jgi:alpha-L-fucosidase
VSKNGNLLLDVGPEADGTIPAVQMERLKALGAWLKQNGEAIYDTTPWTQAAGKSAEGDDLRFTRKGHDLYVNVLGKPKGRTITMPDLPAKLGVPITQLGDSDDLGAKVQANGTRIVLHGALKGDYAYSFKLAGYLKE